MKSAGSANQLLQPGRNCWRRSRADRVAVLVEPAAYFAAFRAAARRAERSIAIVAWDIDSRLELVRRQDDDGLPPELGAFLTALLEKKPALQVQVLLWDFALFVGFEREWFAKLKFGDHERLHLLKDGHCPVGGYHHQKIVVIDGRLAFVGGIDLTKDRWDVSAHRPGDARRRNPDGGSYRPNHDVQMMVEGDVAADRFRRLRVCYPHRADQPANETILVHAKLLVVDGRLLHVGSANLNNRSMGLDTECGLTIEANGRAEVKALRRLGVSERADERILGSGQFVERVIKESEGHVKRQFSGSAGSDRLGGIVIEFCQKEGVSIKELRSGSRRKPVAQARKKLVRILVEGEGATLAETARHLGVSTSAVSKSLTR